jgi:hypothetical protein
MLLRLLILSIIGLLIPGDGVLINQKLAGYWLVIEDYSNLQAEAGYVRVLKFEKCKRKARKKGLCEYGWCYLDSNSVINNRLNKVVKKNWTPSRSSIYWVAKKKSELTNRVVLHMIDKSEISFSLANKELTIYQENKLIYRLAKLK